MSRCVGVVLVPAKPMTWAALAGRNAAVSGSSTAVASAASGRTQTPAAPVTSSARRSPAPDNSQLSKTPTSYAARFVV